jgi:dienelactone hydrolase
MRHVLVALVLAFPALCPAAIQMKPVEYKDGDTVLEGFLIHDDAKVTQAKPAPGVLVIHQWLGITDHEKARARMLAELGYVAFVADIYGKGDRPKDRSEAPKWAGKYKGDRKLFRKRLTLAFDELRKQPGVDKARIGAIGFCFGGTGVLELGRSGADVAGVVSFHGGLDSPSPADGKNIKAKVLVLHGAADPFVPEPDIAAFRKELDEAKVDWQMVWYSGAVHAFTQKEAGNDASKGAAYQEHADKRSWTAMRNFFDEAFAARN